MYDHHFGGASSRQRHQDAIKAAAKRHHANRLTQSQTQPLDRVRTALLSVIHLFVR